MRIPHPRTRGKKQRNGVSAVECVVVLSVWLLIIFATFDICLAAFRYDTLSEVARLIARQAIVRGEQSAPESTPWGPETYAGSAADDTEVGQVARTLLPTMNADDVTIQIEWIDGGNAEDDRIYVRVEYVHQPLSPFQVVADGLLLTGNSTMRIAN